MWPTTIGIVVLSSIEESFGIARTRLRVELDDCVQVEERMEHLGRNKEPMRKVGQNVRKKTRKIIFITYPDMVD